MNEPREILKTLHKTTTELDSAKAPFTLLDVARAIADVRRVAEEEGVDYNAIAITVTVRKV